jgi:predicted dehydrogenase
VLDLFEPVAASCDLTIPPRLRRPIVIVGAGAIVQFAHLPAYAKAGLPIAGICDLDEDRARTVCAAFSLARTYSIDELLADDSIEVVDIAVVPDAQPELAVRALRAGKHVLAQKPLAVDSILAREVADVAAESSRSLVVNQQMRYGEGIAAARAMVDLGWLGELTAVTIDVNINTDWSAWSWLVNSPQLDLMYHSIHYLDSIRSLLGSPSSVFCAGGRRPGQLAVGETRTMTTLLFDSGARAHVNVNHENLTGDYEARFRIDGSAGSIRGTIGLLYDYPHGRPDTVEINSTVIPTDGWLPYPVTTRWIPDAFAGPMRALLMQIDDGTPAPTRADDAIQTLELVEACYRSIDSGQVQSL